MAPNAASPELLKLCRFCLSEEKTCLISIGDVLDFELTMEDIVRFTGIELNDQTKEMYYVCVECTNKVKISSNFRNTCLNNDPLFHELCLLASSVQETYDKAIECLESDLEELTDPKDSHPLEDHSMDILASEDACEHPMESNTIVAVNALNSSQRSSPVHSVASSPIEILESDDELFSYSANHIRPGEKLYFEDVIHKSHVDWITSLNPAFTPTPTVPHPRDRGKRRLLMCDRCALLVRDLQYHMLTHNEEATFCCPHCPVRTKQKANLRLHIEQVHRKVICRTCKICGKGFVHHKTYRYHMLTHEGEGKTFECPDCSKTFLNAIFLRDHFNRLHNAAKLVNKTETQNKNVVQRKRPRLQATATEISKE